MFSVINPAADNLSRPAWSLQPTAGARAHLDGAVKRQATALVAGQRPGLCRRAALDQGLHGILVGAQGGQVQRAVACRGPAARVQGLCSRQRRSLAARLQGSRAAAQRRARASYSALQHHQDKL